MAPTLETPGGAPVEVTPVDPAAVNAAFAQAMNDDGADEHAPPKRQPRQPAEDKPRARTAKADKARAVKAAPVALDDAQRAAGVAGIAQIGAGLALMYGKASGKKAFEADAVTVAQAAPQFADAAVQIAKTDPAFAARLDRVCASGPYAALIAVGANVILQCIRNHRPQLALPGTIHPDELLKQPEPAAA